MHCKNQCLHHEAIPKTGTVQKQYLNKSAQVLFNRKCKLRKGDHDLDLITLIIAKCVYMLELWKSHYSHPWDLGLKLAQ